MRQFTYNEFIKLVKYNGYHYARSNGSHNIYINNQGNHISIPVHLECVIALRLIKENSLVEIHR